MIVKFQTDTSGSQLLMHNEDKSYLTQTEGDVTAQIIESVGMGPFEKKFFECDITEKDNGEVNIAIGDEVEDQGW